MHWVILKSSQETILLVGEAPSGQSQNVQQDCFLTGRYRKRCLRQIPVNEDDVEFSTNIQEREIPEEPLKYRLLTVTYGIACAPYLSIRTTPQLAKKKSRSFQRHLKLL
ncbi:hypothetical protein TNCV_4179931 [Trichonephila clavipes]|nr:hypothetical protein TNCV_4179931 [Trichonephila clavipes]